mgnify:CR=1 FL=1|tara:strand:+ start:157 stop:669 length:513 start_codon:yes stop_codon:yes gene_type:complete
MLRPTTTGNDSHLREKPFSDHPEDVHLWVVLRKNHEREYVTHMFNMQTGGYSLGHYHMNQMAADADYDKRGRASADPERWRVRLDVPTCAIPGGHIVEVVNEAELPVCVVPPGGGTHGAATFRKFALRIAALPEMESALRLICDSMEAGNLGAGGYTLGCKVLRDLDEVL